MTNLIILSKEIRQTDGRFLLNDIHKASGEENKHRPSYFLTNKQTQDLVFEIEKIAGIPAIVKKQGVGTYVCKELVYSYAMWINPKFHLKVIRAFDQLMRGDFLQSSKKYNYPRKLLEQDGFITPELYASLNISMLANKHYVSPLMHLLNELRVDGHDVSAAWAEAIAMRDGILEADATLNDIYMKALKANFKSASTSGNK